jgi:purine-binding chemotaxis protein CheW
VRRVLAALPLEHVVETMRPLPVAPLAEAPAFVMGVAIVRGEPTPVVDAGALLGVADEPCPTRFVTMRTGGRQVALAVEGVLDVRDLDRDALHELPPLLGCANTEAVTALGALDAGLLVVLRAALAVSDAFWESIATYGGRS